MLLLEPEFNHGTDGEIIQYLEQGPGDILKCTDNHGKSLLHLYAGTKHSQLQDYLLEKYPNIIYTEDENMNTPLISAIEYRNASLVKKILNIDPEVLYLNNKDDICPFFVEITREEGGTEDVLREMMIHYDEERFSFGFLLNYTMITSASKAKFLLKDKLDYVDNLGRNVLSIAASNGSSQSSHTRKIIKYILSNTDPGLLLQSDNNGNLPLHYAGYSLFFDIIYEQYKEAIFIKNNIGSTPLHTRVTSHNSYTDIYHIVRSLPDALNVKNNDGDTPVMLVAQYCRMDECVDFLKLCFSTNPTSFLIKNNKNNTVIHEICKYKPRKWYEIVDRILEKYPGVLFEADEFGLLPLDYGIRNIGDNCCKLDKEMFLATCLKYTSLPDKYWDVFYGSSLGIYTTFPYILQRSTTEASKAMKFLPTHVRAYIKFLVTTLSKIGIFEPEHIQLIISFALEKK